MNIKIEARLLSIVDFAKKLVSTVLSLCKIMLLTNFRLKLPKRKTSRACYVLGNGPSLTASVKEHRETIRDNDTLMVNFSYKTDLFTDVKPNIYLLLDPNFFSGNYIADHKPERFLSVVTWTIDIYVPYKYRNSLLVTQYLNKNPHITVFFFNYVIYKGFESLNSFFYKKGLAMPQCQNVLVASLFQMVNRNYSKIYLLGAENYVFRNISVDQENRLILNDTHYYNKTEYRVVSLSISELFLSLHKAFGGYQNVEKYAKKVGVNIYNLTPDSAIDAFERKTREEV